MFTALGMWPSPDLLVAYLETSLPRPSTRQVY